mmetsp:Transcript_73982/g.203688  ORF Transcript_73982/g.203688 Transcript_73982/m.203688 type:complete len:83 (+) Transcript_73982:558-806(+)
MASDVSFGPHKGFVSAAPHRALLSRQRALPSSVCIAQRALHLGFQFLQLRFDGIIVRFFAFALAVNNWFRGALVTLLGNADV